MADDKYAKSKCFILSSDGYEEITYSELYRRKDTDISYRLSRFTECCWRAHWSNMPIFTAQRTDSGIWIGGRQKTGISPSIC